MMTSGCGSGIYYPNYTGANVVNETSTEQRDREQSSAVHHRGSPARLLAGPGTGKTWTLTNRVIDLVQDPAVLPTDVLALTFTRAAAQELRTRVRGAIGNETAPYVATLHSFALRHLVRYQDEVDALPLPIRVADDWEEANIIRRDLADILSIGVRDIDELLKALAADWEKLNADQDGWEQVFPDPAFLGAWRRHRETYGYTLRGELVYQLKRALERNPDFAADAQPRHLLVDEFQDLNPCDLGVVHHLRERGAEMFVAGDDDQSIYGFRHALPQAIRDFVVDFGAANLGLGICSRCDPEILRFADWLIRQEVGRVPKAIRAEDGKAPGSVELHGFDDQAAEAEWIANRCVQLEADGTDVSEILILLRGDRYGVYSSVLTDALDRAGMPVHVDVGGDGPLETGDGRRLLALLRLVVSPEDSLALRTLLVLDRGNHLGEGATRAIEELADELGGRFADALRRNQQEDSLGRHSQSARVWLDTTDQATTSFRAYFDLSLVPPDDRAAALVDKLENLPVPGMLQNPDEVADAITEFLRIQAAAEADDLPDLLRSIGATLDDDERVTDPNTINILTMHKAKGLGREAVFIVGAEDETLPGRASNNREMNEERRLLYVSATRARHSLFMTYCKQRTGAQSRTGRTGRARRTLTRFLRDGYIQPTVH